MGEDKLCDIRTLLVAEPDNDIMELENYGGRHNDWECIKVGMNFVAFRVCLPYSIIKQNSEVETLGSIHTTKYVSARLHLQGLGCQG